MVSAQQTNLLPKNALRNDAIFAQNIYRIYATTSQYLRKFLWLRNHHGIYCRYGTMNNVILCATGTVHQVARKTAHCWLRVCDSHVDQLQWSVIATVH